MSKKTSYSANCEKEISWLKSVSNDHSYMYCILCCKQFKMDGGGISQVRSHGNGKLHREREHQAQGQSNQHTFVVTGTKQLSMSRGQFVLQLSNRF